MVCVNLNERKVVATDKFPSTVKKDALIGLGQCFDSARTAIGEVNFQSALKLATSSAAGGLRMAVVGLTKSLSIEAGRNASFSAGAKIVYNAAGTMGQAHIRGIEESGAEILLLCGGYEGGNTKTTLHNAEMISQSEIMIPIIYSGNSAIAREVRNIVKGGGKECFLAENIIPNIGCSNIEPTTRIIRELFMSRITNMKGISAVRDKIHGDIIPTPASVLAAGELLSMGSEKQAGIGPMMMADVGGATTDIYSFIENRNYPGAKLIGTPSPFAKRTVEGDMGMRESSSSLLKEIGEEVFAQQYQIPLVQLKEAVDRRLVFTEYIADNLDEKELDNHIACNAVKISARRHVGYVKKEYSSGCRLVQYGKSLVEIKKVIGLGGAIVNADDKTQKDILKNVQVMDSEKGRVLLPEDVNILVDSEYVFFAAGLLREYDEDAALAIMKKSIKLKE